MPTEIERKFLVAGDGWRDDRPGVRIAQGYLCRDPGRTVRVRIAGGRSWLTIKGPTEGIARAEFEYEIPIGEGRELLELFLPPVIDKTRYEVAHGGHVWEVDVFHGENDGLVVAEVELDDVADDPELPPWVGAEISDDPRYFNSRLAELPYRHWKPAVDGG